MFIKKVQYKDSSVNSWSTSDLIIGLVTSIIKNFGVPDCCIQAKVGRRSNGETHTVWVAGFPIFWISSEKISYLVKNCISEEQKYSEIISSMTDLKQEIEDELLKIFKEITENC